MKSSTIEERSDLMSLSGQKQLKCQIKSYEPYEFTSYIMNKCTHESLYEYSHELCIPVNMEKKSN